MKIEKANAGPLTNFEVFNFLKSRGATSDPMGCLGSVSPSECKVFEYLTKTPASTQSKESVEEFRQKSDKFKLTNTEKLNIINLRPTGQPELYSMIKDCAKRYVKTEERIIGGEMETVTLEDKVQEILDLVEEIYPQPAEEIQEEV
ncbi:hypothetical protein LUZ60_002379 [Juncus effusus]|nr:hypothetical protein LUZ60_002379 [Juncus effusus]